MSRLAPYLREIRPTLTLAAPIIVGHLSQMLMGLTDSLMIGRSGTVPLAAASFGGSVFNVFFVLGIGLMLPVAIFVSRARGAQQPEEAAEFLRHGVAVAVVFGAAETLVMAVLSTQLPYFGQPPEVVAIVIPFYLLIAASIVPVLFYLALRQFAEAMGHPWAPMVILLGGVALNVVLNWVFIYGHLGLPALGLTGAGLSTLISRVIDAVALFWWLRRDARLRAAWPRRWLGGYSRTRFREMFGVGVPASTMLLFENSAFAFSGIMIGWLGSVPLAAHQIAISCASMVFMIPLGLAIAAGMRVSHAVGADEPARLRPIGFGVIGLGVVVTSGFGVVFALGGSGIAAWFVHDAAVIALTGRLMMVAALFQMVDGVQVIAANMLRGVGDVKIPTVITLIAYWVIALPVGYLLGIRGAWGAPGVWMGIAGGLAFAAVFLAARFARLTRLGGQGS